MNACIRAVVRTAVPLGHDAIGIRRGYQGLLDEDFYFSYHRMGAHAVDALIDGHSGKMVAERQGELVPVPFEQTFTRPKILATSLMTLLTELAR